MAKLGPITLYYNMFTRAGRPRWILEELGVPYDLKHMDLAKKEHKEPEYMKIHPLGMLPAMRIGDRNMIESGAMCFWLADMFPEKNLVPPLDSPARADYYQWSLFAMNHLEPELMKVFLHGNRLPEDERSPEILKQGLEGAKKALGILEGAIGKGPYLLGKQFTTADVLVGGSLIWAASMGLTAEFGGLGHYIGELKARPAHQRANSK